MNFEHTKGLVFGVGLDFKLLFFIILGKRSSCNYLQIVQYYREYKFD